MLELEELLINIITIKFNITLHLKLSTFCLC